MSKQKKPVLPAAPTDAKSTYRIRVVELRWMRASELQANPGNWRMHPAMQKDAAKDLLAEVGVADALVAYWSERYGGWTLIDGHLRQELDGDQLWPVLIVDLDDDEADKALLTHDSIGMMAETNAARVEALAENVLTGSLALREMIRKLQQQGLEVIEDETTSPKAKLEEEAGPPNMELMPFEHYDYVMLFAKSSISWERMITMFGIERRTFPTRSNKHWDGKIKRVGVCRIMDADKVMDLLDQKIADAAKTKRGGGNE